MSIFCGGSLLNRLRRLACGGFICGTLLVGATVASAQANPNFTAGGETSLVTGNSLVMVPLPDVGKTLMVYRDYNTGNLFLSQSGDGINWGSPVNTGIALVNGAIAAADISGTAYILANTTAYGWGVIETTNGTSWGSLFNPSIHVLAGSSLNGTYKPSLVSDGVYLYLSVTTNGPTYSAQVQVLKSTDGGRTFNNPVLPDTYSSTSGSSLAIYNGKLFEAHNVGPNNNPVVAQSSNSGSSFSYTLVSNLQLGSDPELIPFTPAGQTTQALYIFGRGNSSNNLWAAGSYSGTTFTTWEHPSTLTFTPAVAIAPNGNLAIAFKSNYGSNIWAYTAPHN